ncbi:MAG: hypothetical protein R3B95_11700 [Nitrospirales bacterium]|nr:hypothetical protein [Nitrospirales bacterium]
MMGEHGKNTNLRFNGAIREVMEGRAASNGETITGIIRRHTLKGIICEVALDLMRVKGFAFTYHLLQSGFSQATPRQPKPKDQEL